ncbi:MAG: ROK family protein [Chloroflexota bacterium]
MAEGARSRHVGLDLGGTNLKWAIVEHDPAADAWTTIDRGQVPTDRGGPVTIVPQMAAVAVEAIARAGGARSVGVGVPGLYVPETGETDFLPNTPGDWHGVPVAGPIAVATGLPATLINDARAFGLAELRLGAGRGARTMVGLTLGTGIGGVLCLDGRVVLGYRGQAGEFGHMTLDPDGPPCRCGNHGCLEAFARADRLAEACGVTTPEEAMARAAAGDAQALAGFRRVGRYLGQAIANLVLLATPDCAVLGGGMSAAGELLLAPIREELRTRVTATDPGRVRLAIAELGTWAGAIGAAVHGAEAAADREAAGAVA